MKLFVFGNGNTSFEEYTEKYVSYLCQLKNAEFLVCDFRGVDTLTMEYLKTKSSKVSVYHIGEKPRYLPARYRTKVSSWELFGGYTTDHERDMAAIYHCTHFLAFDFNVSAQRKSGTATNIEQCLRLDKIPLTEVL
ncbi:hypothetical protein [Candidatus Uabimicrobium amorphum]|uniref:Uncharacterized protein n=1 Tax=Uabimicrobium amorphum TaxID=2596890 RepID=A0A5S9F7A4_UABAM|nr:hypothetical protein [Candidatus Uabimicrobium amorphum]BBM87042.1 hypothetical protein UABAM_05444 [Candidatus Uabimicrobium amorphum]